MHIVHVGVAPATETLLGPVRAVTAYARQLVEMGHRVTMVEMAPGLPQRSFESVDGIESLTLPAPRLTTALGPPAARFFEENVPGADIFHFHSSYARHWAAARRSPVPYVVSPHGAYLPLNRARTALRSVVFRALIGRRYLRRASFVHAITRDEAAVLHDYGGNELAIEVIPNAMQGAFSFDPAERASQRAAMGISDDEQVLLYVGRMDVFGKGLDILFPAVHAANNDRKNRLHLVCVGPKGRYWREEINHSDEIRFFQPAMGAEKRRILAAADAFVTLSRWDVMPTAVLDALDSGLPLILTSQTGFADFIRENSEVGTVVGLDAAEVTRVLRGLGNGHAETRAHIYDVAAAQFHPRRVAEAFAAAYERVLSRRETAAPV